MAEITITLAELQAELQRLGIPAEEAKGSTLAELSDQWNLSRAAVKGKLQKAHKLGILCSGRKQTVAIDGSVRVVPSYWLKTASKPAKSGKK